jgi:hypothetical protein
MMEMCKGQNNFAARTTEKLLGALCACLKLETKEGFLFNGVLWRTLQ